MSEFESNEVCTNCGKAYKEHFETEDYVYCNTFTNGDLFTTDPTEEQIQEIRISQLEAENKQLKAEIKALRERELECAREADKCQK